MAWTESGATARLVAQAPSRAARSWRCRPLPATARRLALVWGVVPIVGEEGADTDAMLEDGARARAVGRACSSRARRAVITAGIPKGVAGSTNLIKAAVAQAGDRAPPRHRRADGASKTHNIVFGVFFFILGVIGVLIPVMPQVLFFFMSALFFSLAFPTVRRASAAGATAIRSSTQATRSGAPASGASVSRVSKHSGTSRSRRNSLPTEGREEVAPREPAAVSRAVERLREPHRRCAAAVSAQSPPLQVAGDG